MEHFGRYGTVIISKWLNANIVNLGFAGNAKGEPEMAELISNIKMSAFIMDYDYNATSVEHLEKTHENFFRIVRGKQSNLIIIMISLPNYGMNPDNSKARRAIIYKTYKNAINRGDKNVYFIDGQTLFGTEDRDACTVDGCHPNDLGFMRMAENIYPTVKRILRP